MNNKVTRLIERVRLTPEEIKSHWTSMEGMSSTHFGVLKAVAQAQLNKVLNDTDLALIDRDFLWKIKAMLRGVQIKQQSDPSITWETSLDVALKEFDDSIIPLAKALKEKK